MLKTFKSKVIYCLTFSQGSSLELGKTQERHDITKNHVHGSEKLNSEQSSLEEDSAASGNKKKVKFSNENDVLLLKLKGKDLSWKEIVELFPRRSQESCKCTIAPS